jgi:ectoine hydroxylase-related dioxygenase (phytanoyl-CoA dioxygenase family)
MSNDSHNRFSASDPELGSLVAEAVECDGYAVVTDLIDPAACARLIGDVEALEAGLGTTFGANDFEGFRTRRIFNLISRGEAFRDLVLHSRMEEVIESILGDGFLLSGTTSMHLFPGETPQLLHADDGMISLPRPHPATLVTTLWALSPFTPENGGTLLVPGSHKRTEMPRPGEKHDAIAVAMPAGSALVLHGSTWHGGGRNSTDDQERFGLSIQFVAGWCRQQQNLMLGTPREVVAGYPRKLQERIGYSIYRNVMGHVDRTHPLALLGVDAAPEMVWEKMSEPDNETA